MGGFFCRRSTKRGPERGADRPERWIELASLVGIISVRKPPGIISAQGGALLPFWLPTGHQGWRAAAGHRLATTYSMITDLGSKNQKGSVGTRYGHAPKQLTRCVGDQMRAHGYRRLLPDLVEKPAASGGNGPGGFAFRLWPTPERRRFGGRPASRRNRDDFPSERSPGTRNVPGPRFSSFGF